MSAREPSWGLAGSVFTRCSPDAGSYELSPRSLDRQQVFLEGQVNTIPDPQVPGSFPRRILVATMGLAPQVLTETLFCLVKRSEAPFVPTEIHVITTQEGAHRARLTLIDPAVAKLKALELEHDIAGLSTGLPVENIHVIAGSGGQFLDDIDCAEDNSATADLITELVRKFAQDPDCAMHVSIAGGRKTMGFLLGYAISLFGRHQDRLSHVLVSRPFQEHPNFFFPPAVPVVLHDRQNRPVSTSDANLILADIPFVRLRGHLPRPLLDGDNSYSETVKQAQLVFAAREMVLDSSRSMLTCQGIEVPLPPQTFALMAWLARRLVENGPEEGALRWDRDDWSGYMLEYERIRGVRPEQIARLGRRLRKELSSRNVLEDRENFFHEHLSRLRRKMSDSLGELGHRYAPATRGFRGNSRVELLLQPDELTFLD